MSLVQVQLPLPFKNYGVIRFHIAKRPGGQAVKTPPFHGGNTGSIPVRVTTSPSPFSPIWRHSSAGRASASHAEGHRFEFCCLHHLRTPHRTVWCSCFLGGCASFSATTRIGISSSSSLFCSFSPKPPPMRKLFTRKACGRKSYCPSPSA